MEKPEDYQNLWEYKIKSVFKKEVKMYDSEKMLWNIITLLLYSSTKDKLLIDIYNFFEDKNDFVKFISLVNGRTLKIPTKKEMEDALLTAVFYYEKIINGKSWKEIQDDLDFDISPIKYGIRVKNLNSWILQKLQELIR